MTATLIALILVGTTMANYEATDPHRGTVLLALADQDRAEQSVSNQQGELRNNAYSAYAGTKGLSQITCAPCLSSDPYAALRQELHTTSMRPLPRLAYEPEAGANHASYFGASPKSHFSRYYQLTSELLY